MANHGSDKSPDTVVLAVTGMTCAGCAKTLDRVLSGIEGVAQVHVDPASNRATVTGTATAERLIRAVEDAGFGARVA
jgi:copper chaperone CopZ